MIIIIMKSPIHIRQIRSAVLVAACVFLGLCTPERASAAPKQRTLADSHLRGSARLVIHRSPNLGANIIVRLFIDGVSAAPLTYGLTSRHLVPAGRRLVTVLPSPDPRPPIPISVSLDARPGRTYHLTVRDGGSGPLGIR